MFHDRLYQLRKARGISQEELSDIVGVSRQAVQKWESGASKPDMDKLVAIARYFGVTLDYLITGEETPQPEPAPQSRYGEPHRFGPNAWPWHYEYRSKLTLFGLPLVHVNLTHHGFTWARGVIAIGNVATGVVALGAFSAGLIALGGIAFGLLAMGGVAAGQFAAGGVAVGQFAVGGAAIGGTMAEGGAAMSWRRG